MGLDLKINFEDLERVLQSIRNYRSALADISGASERFLEALQRQESEAFEALSQVWIEKVQADEEELGNRLDELADILQRYINEMLDYIEPVDSSAMVRVDKADIYYNMMQIELATDRIQDICWDTGSSYANYRTYIDPESPYADWLRAQQDAECQKRERNYEILQNFRNDIAGAFREEMNEYMRQMWAIYTDYIEPFEAADDRYGYEAGNRYWEWANANDHFENARRAIADVGRGAKDQLSEIWDGMITLGLASNPTVQAERLVGQGDAEVNAEIEGFNQGITQMVKDPIGTAEVVGQTVSDRMEEEGLAYGVGFLGTDVALGWVTKKMVGGTKAVDVSQMADATGDVASATSKLDDIVDTASDVSSVANKVDDVADAAGDVQGVANKVENVVEEAVEGGASTSKPNQVHHYATDKSKTYTQAFKDITDKYGLDLDADWNKDLLPHQGRHPNAYHDFVLDEMRNIDNIANGNKDIFLELYESEIKSIVRDNPDMLYSNYWKSIKE